MGMCSIEGAVASLTAAKLNGVIGASGHGEDLPVVFGLARELRL